MKSPKPSQAIGCPDHRHPQERLTSGSCGWGSKDPEKIRKSISPPTILAPICWSPPKGPASSREIFKAQFAGQHRAGGAVA